MPPKTRASAISAIASEKLAYKRVPGRISEVRLKAVFSPKAAARMNAAAPLYVGCAEGYSGWAGGPVRESSNGLQLASGSPGAAPALIAVTGRQKMERYLLSHHAVIASAIVTLSIANKCSFCGRL